MVMASGRRPIYRASQKSNSRNLATEASALRLFNKLGLIGAIWLILLEHNHLCLGITIRDKIPRLADGEWVLVVGSLLLRQVLPLFADSRAAGLYPSSRVSSCGSSYPRIPAVCLAPFVWCDVRLVDLQVGRTVCPLAMKCQHSDCK